MDEYVEICRHIINDVFKFLYKTTNMRRMVHIIFIKGSTTTFA